MRASQKASDPPAHDQTRPGVLGSALEAARRAYREFLKLPALVIGAFLVLAVAVYALDLLVDGGAEGPAKTLLFNDPESTRDFLATITSGLLTVTSITFSLLLLAVQQGAAAMTSVVLDQFLRRPANRFYFGFFVGLTLYAMVILTSVSPDNNPIIGASLALALTMAALVMLIVLIYTTVDQMRAVTIINAIRDHTLEARARQGELLRRTGADRLHDGPATAVSARDSGFLVKVDLDRLESVVQAHGRTIAIAPSIGSYVAIGDPLAHVSPGHGDLRGVEGAVRKALCIERERDIETDPAYGIAQLLNIAWTSISTSKQNPEPGLLVCDALRDLLVRWSDAPERATGARVTYRDGAIGDLMDAFESIGVVASESMQHQTFAKALTVLAVSFGRLPDPLRDRVEDIVRRALSGLGDHVPTREVEAALSLMSRVLREDGRVATADSVDAAAQRLAGSIGRLNSRATRVSGTA